MQINNLSTTYPIIEKARAHLEKKCPELVPNIDGLLSAVKTFDSVCNHDAVKAITHQAVLILDRADDIDPSCEGLSEAVVLTIGISQAAESILKGDYEAARLQLQRVVQLYGD